MSFFEKFRKREREEKELAEERRQEAVRRAQDELTERLKKKHESESQEEVNLTKELNN